MSVQGPDPTDIIIVGAGIAGFVAALELTQAGRRVLLLDRDTEQNLGGQARESFGGIFAVDTDLQRRNGIRDSAALALADWSRFGELAPEDGWPCRWAEAYARECGRAVFNWLRALGVRFLPMPLWPERRGNSVAQRLAAGRRPVIVEIAIDYSKKPPSPKGRRARSSVGLR